jgi:hypothetical protein
MSTVHEDYRVPEEEVLAIAASYDKTIIVDLDETLYFQNSTADFIDCAIPGVLALIVLKILDVFGPWRWTGGGRTRDIWRVRVVLALFPWTLSRWKRRCLEATDALTNVPLLRTLRERGFPFIIATTGFSVLVGPLLSAMGCGDAQLIACRLNKSADRKAGKLILVEEKIGASALAEAMVVTDSTDDLDLLRRCACPCLTRWKGARYQRPFRRVYLPGIYTTKVKRPGGKGIGGIITTLTFWLLASMTSGAFEPSTVLAILLLFLSLWSIYEIGYMDNDICAQKYETDPVLTDEICGFPYKAAASGAWISALVLGSVGCCFTQNRPWLISFVEWILLLCFTRSIYYYYNRIDKKTRVWLYLILQLCREASFMLVVPVGVVGVMACSAQIVSRWQQYFIYRGIGAFDISTWPEIQFRTIRLFLFILLAGALEISEQRINLWAWPTAAIVVWCAFLARREVLAIIWGAHRIDTKAKAGGIALFSKDSGGVH